MTGPTAYVYCIAEGCRARMACNWRHLDNLRASYRCTEHKKEARRGPA